MPLTTDEKLLALSHEIIEKFDKLNGGVHPGFRPAHAKGILLTGIFTPSPEAGSLTRAPHVNRASTPVTVRLSDFAGIPSIADNDPQGASPRGFAVRFHLAEHAHTDIVAHSVDAFPVRTTEEFREFLDRRDRHRPRRAAPECDRAVSWHASPGFAICAAPQAHSDQLCPGIIFRGIRLQVHQRRRPQPLRALPDIACCGQRISCRGRGRRASPKFSFR